MSAPLSDPVDEVRRINHTWFVWGNLAGDTDAFLDALGRRDPELLTAACARAVSAARQASKEKRDPKPDFYGTLFAHATEAEATTYLQDHPWTRRVVEQ